MFSGYHIRLNNTNSSEQRNDVTKNTSIFDVYMENALSNFDLAKIVNAKTNKNSQSYSQGNSRPCEDINSATELTSYKLVIQCYLKEGK